ncbi:sirohydrochlorin chelatase [Nocardioides sp. URHA0020]|uniref:sirohydrochlorin chelatase n=1 Tax=Nocardioides sp. URHA0020 TaxID=1380392 RepID=UPI00048F6BAD|nr:CbiX/SirB N-terminal domain-containing protein [Nocardioides sp. URHA0020]
MTSPGTRLVTVAHGTRHAPGNEVARELTRLAGSRLAMPAVASYVELAEPSFASVMESGRPSVVVPLLLSTGHHIRHDLAADRALGPDPLLATAQAGRLVSAGATPGQPVVLVAAGSSDPLATRDQALAAAYLAERWGGPVRVATLSGLGRRPADLVNPDDAVSPYLLAPGFFADRCRAASARAGVVADVIGAHPAVVDLVVERALAVLADRRSA